MIKLPISHFNYNLEYKESRYKKKKKKEKEKREQRKERERGRTYNFFSLNLGGIGPEMEILDSRPVERLFSRLS